MGKSIIVKPDPALHPEQFDTELALRFVLLLQAVTKVSWSVQQPAG